MRTSWLIALVAMTTLSCARTEPATQEQSAAPPAREVESITPASAAEMVDHGEAVLVDVREKSEVMRGMAAPAIWMPLSTIQVDSPAWQNFVSGAEHDPDKLVVLYCASGGRSGYVAQELAKRSIRTANMGGFSGWQAAGLPTKTPSDPQPGQ